MNNSTDTTAASETLLDTTNGSFHDNVLDFETILSENIANLTNLNNRIKISTNLLPSFEDVISTVVTKTIENNHQIKTLRCETKGKERKGIKKQLEEEIKSLRANIDDTLKEIDDLKAEKQKIESLEVSYEKALKYYTTQFDITVSIENKTSKENYWVKIIFSNRKDLSVRFLIDCLTNRVKDFDAHTLLSLKEEQALKDYYNKTNDISTIFSILRNIAVTVDR